MSGRESERAVLGSADIARLTGVRRPAVSNWRRRYADFPRPVSGSSTNPLFSLAEVERWCRDHGKSFEADAAERLWQRIQAGVHGVRTAEFLAHAGLALTGGSANGSGLAEPDARWAPLLAGVADTAGDYPPLELYERLCARFTAERERAGALDERVAAAMAEIAGAGAGAVVLDPACGSGGLLHAAAERGARVLWGQDVDPAHAVIARSRLLLAGSDCETAAGDTLRADGFSGRTADVVLCDPPFRDRDWGYAELAEDARWVYGQPPRGEGELAWVQHCLARVRPGGRVVVRMPAAAADRPSGRRVRAALVSSGALRMVAELPGGDGPATAHVWVLDRPRNAEPGYGDAEPVLTVAGVRDTRDLVRLWRHRHRPEDGLEHGAGEGPAVAAASVSDLVASGMDLRPAPAREAGLEDAGSAYAQLRTKLVTTLGTVAGLPPELIATPVDGGDGHNGADAPTIAELVASGAVEIHQAPLGAAVDRGPLAVLTYRDLREGAAPSGQGQEVPGRVVIRAGDVVAAVGGRSLARLAGEADEGAALGPRLVLLRCDGERIDPGYLAGVLSSAAVASEEPGQRSRSARFDPRAVRVPAIPVEHQRAHAEAMRRLVETREHLARLAALGDRLAQMGGRGLAKGTLGVGEEPR
ncbi:SAM-dependent methyltransferase [Lipingzhangella halophila]|uniref:SAM-dependent methyltransferase n=1 Tax=Lipingzhangella halophila TaxID=1783352 RepID=A0A7W7W273_9ACTN|nr:N-6 DNA methylase [Lipingzhangella halophila]MBB4931108.1 SAM-dependent methyltransferase [Lipingzhangella halophila]